MYARYVIAESIDATARRDFGVSRSCQILNPTNGLQLYSCSVMQHQHSVSPNKMKYKTEEGISFIILSLIRAHCLKATELALSKQAAT